MEKLPLFYELLPQPTNDFFPNGAKIVFFITEEYFIKYQAPTHSRIPVNKIFFGSPTVQIYLTNTMGTIPARESVSKERILRKNKFEQVSILKDSEVPPLWELKNALQFDERFDSFITLSICT